VARELRRCGFRKLKPFWVPEWYFNEVMERASDWKAQVDQIRKEVTDGNDSEDGYGYDGGTGEYDFSGGRDAQRSRNEVRPRRR